MFRQVYNWMMAQSTRPQAPWILAGTSFLESSISPIPPDPLMIPMILSQPKKAWFFAFLTSVSSAFGAMVGYGIGLLLFDTIGLWIIHTYGLETAFARLQQLFNDWGFWIIVFKAFTPIPFKVVTIASGVAGLNFLVFVIASFLSRSVRFFLVATLLRYYGDTIRVTLERHITLLSFLFLALLVGGFVILKYLY